MERTEYLIQKCMDSPTHTPPGEKGLYKPKVRHSLQTGSSGGIKWCSFVFLGCCQTPWNDSVERNVRFPSFIIMVTLKPNYSHLNTSLLAMLLLITAPKCTAWQGSSLPELAGQLRHYTGVWKGHGAAAGVLGLVASAMPALVLCGGRERYGTCGVVTHCVAILHVPQRLVPGRYTREFGRFTSETLQFRIVSKNDYNSKYNQEAAHHLWLLLKDKHQEPLLVPSCCKILSVAWSPPLLVAVMNTWPDHIWCRFSVARLVPSITLHIFVSVHSKNQAARLKSRVSKHFAFSQENFNW